jgi:hypothetical protein
MLNVRNSIKNSALLRNVTALKPKIDCETRWSAKVQMAERFVTLRPFLLQIAQDPNSTLTFNETSGFLKEVNMSLQWMKEVNVVTVALQKDCIQLSICMQMIEKLDSKIKKYKNRPATISGVNNCFHNCPLKIRKCYTSYEDLCPDPFFVEGVRKIQDGAWNSLSLEEKNACQGLLKTHCYKIDPTQDSAKQEENDTMSNNLLGSPIGMASQIEEIQIQQAESSVLDPCPYVNCNFIFGSAAKVERLWSMGKRILRYDRSSMTPFVFETMLFLKVN